MTSPTPQGRLPRARRRELFAFALSLSRARISVKLGLVFYGAFTLGLAALAAALSARGRAVGASLPGLSSDVLAWGPGMLVALSAGFHAFRHDLEHGAIALVRTRGVPLSAFVFARVTSLAALLAAATAAGTIVVTLAAALGARSVPITLTALHGGTAGVLHALAFGAVMAPVTFATLGTRSRGSGYVALFVVLVVPELARFVVRDLPREWTELMSIPSALTALRSALSPGHVDATRALGAVLVLAVASVLASAAAVKQASLLARASHEVTA